MLKMLIPIIIVIVSNCFYHTIAKKTPSDANALLSLTITYGVAAISSFIMFFIGNHGASISDEVKKLNWTSFALGVVIIGLELGYILVYRAGWDVSRAPLIANTCLAVALIFIGFILFKEHITARQIIGIAICIVGLVVVSK